MYVDEYPGGFSPERVILRYLSDQFPNTLILSREKNTVVITMNIPEVDENTDYVKCLINEKYHMYRQICKDVPHRGRTVSISLRLGTSRFNFAINEDNSVNAYGFTNLSNFSASIISASAVKKERLQLNANPKSYLLNLKSELSGGDMFSKINDNIKGIRKW
ncbi:hypothetical protein [Mucilaginibacter sp.]|uniref:hypothetical protein n=1 Tax=Mucilaginibacter sp. TaxID=1882438 RepID=UPI0025EEADE3|nr:hypothetical protein [Mucilaginibacter sp.]